MKAIILAAGKGTRMYPLTLTTPKLLLPILNETILDHFIKILNGYVDGIVLVVSESGMADKIRAYIKEKKYPLKFDFVYQEKQLGTGHAVQCAKKLFKKGEEFLVMNGDDLYSPETIEAVIKEPLAGAYQPVDDPEKWGIHKRNKDGNLIEIIEKPQEYVGNGANTGFYKLNSRIFELFKDTEISPRGEYEITDSVNLLSKESPIKSIKVKNYWIPVGYPWHLLHAQEKMIGKSDFEIEGEIENHVSIEGNLKLGKGSVIKSGSRIEGNVIIGDNCNIGPNTYLKGNLSIGNDCTVNFSSHIENSILMSGVEIDNFCHLSDAVIGRNVKINSGVIAKNHTDNNQNIEVDINGKLIDTGRLNFSTTIGDNAKININSSILPGCKIWPNISSSPGKIIGKDILST